MQNVWLGQEIVLKPLGLLTLVVATCVRDERVARQRVGAAAVVGDPAERCAWNA